MPGNPVKLGPFKGGLNNKSQVGEAKPDELVELINLEVTTDEALTSRPPIEMVKGTVRTVPGGTVNWKILCIFRSSPTTWYLIVSEPVNDGGVAKVRVNAYINGDLSSVPIQIESPTAVGDEVADAVQFADEVFFIRNSDSSMVGFKWGPQTPYTTLSALPRGKVIVSWKTRLWVAGRTDSSGIGAQLRYSDIKPTGPEPSTWPPENYVDVAYGEGGFITSLIPLQNSLIVFKSDGTWRFTYPSQVKDGSVDVLSSSIGAASRHSVVELENVVYVYDQGTVYEMVNNNFTKINDVLEIREDRSGVNGPIADIEMSVINRRIVIRYSNAVYSLNLDTKAWSQWRTYSGTPGKFFEIPAESSIAKSPVYLTASCGTNITEEIFERNFDSITSKNGTETLTAEEELFLPLGESIQFSAPYADGDNAPQTFNYPVAIGHQLEVSVTANSALVVRVDILDAAGAVIPLTVNPTAAGTRYVYSFNLTAALSPTGSSLLAVRLYIENNSIEVATLKDVQVRRKPSATSSAIFKLEDSYTESSVSKELIICSMRTRGVDMGSPQTWKRLHWWGLDIKTFFEVVAVAIPNSKEQKVYWREIDKYTNGQLLQGTYRNPLSWLLRSVSIFNRHNPEYDISEDGRFFKKLAKALRFQRISFEYETKTHGTLSTGPAKIFTITPMVKDKRVVVDTNT